MSKVTLTSNLGRIAAAMPRRIDEARIKTGQDVARRMKSRGGKNFGDVSGDTRNSVRWDGFESRATMTDAARYVEYGSVRETGVMPAFRPARRAAKAGRIAFERRVAKALQDM